MLGMWTDARVENWLVNFTNQLGWEQSWPFYLLPLALLPLFLRGYHAFSHPAVQHFPEDAVSRWLSRLWRIAGAIALIALSVALTRPYLAEQSQERIGQGAHVMIVLDRSASMNDDFAQTKSGLARAVDQHAVDHVSKMQVARKLLDNLVQQGRNDLIGMVTFSTSPILAAPLTADRQYVRAALAATEAGGMGFTAVARGLGMGLDYFEGKPLTGARAILLVSDGGAHLDGKTQDMLRAMFIRQNASLYWIYLRSQNGTSLKHVLGKDESVDAYPEFALHEYFQTLHVPYHVYEAENPQALANAMQDIARLKNKPTRYQEPVSRKEIGTLFYALAWIMAVILLLLYSLEVKS